MCRIFASQPPENFAPVAHSIRLNGQSTSIRLEQCFWEILDDIAHNEDMTAPAFLSKLHDEVLMEHGEVVNFTSLLRCACILHIQNQHPAQRPENSTAQSQTFEKQYSGL